MQPAAPALPALPVTPLTDEQKAELKTLAEGATPGPWRSTWDDEADPADLNEVVVETVAPQEKPYGSVVVGLLWYDGPHAACTRENSAYIAAANPAATLSLLAENARLSLLLEEERRKSEQLVDDLERAGQAGVCIQQLMLHGTIDTFRAAEMMEALSSDEWHEYHRLGKYTPKPEAAATCQRDCQKCEKAENRTGSELLDLMLCPSQMPNPHKDPNFLGCWGNAECPCDSKCPEDCPLYMAPEPEAAAAGSGVGLQGEEGGGRG